MYSQLYLYIPPGVYILHNQALKGEQRDVYNYYCHYYNYYLSDSVEKGVLQTNNLGASSVLERTRNAVGCACGWCNPSRTVGHVVFKVSDVAWVHAIAGVRGFNKPTAVSASLVPVLADDCTIVVPSFQRQRVGRARHQWWRETVAYSACWAPVPPSVHPRGWSVQVKVARGKTELSPPRPVVVYVELDVSPSVRHSQERRVFAVGKVCFQRW